VGGWGGGGGVRVELFCGWGVVCVGGQFYWFWGRLSGGGGLSALGVPGVGGGVGGEWGVGAGRCRGGMMGEGGVRWWGGGCGVGVGGGLGPFGRGLVGVWGADIARGCGC